ncbi:MAG: DUF3570 domain-containing protein [Methylohalobius sp.]|nr:DUF3570 domain-containing protein [Methylohalobius sp.]
MNKSQALTALTSAALLLPGLAAENSQVSLQYSRYQEGKRNLFDVKSQFDPLQVDTTRFSLDLGLYDRWRLGLTYTEDVWSGATPIATAPLAAQPNRPLDVTSGASPLLTGQVELDADLNPLRGGIKDSRLVHVLATASPEVRRAGDFRLGYEWNEAELSLLGGFSLENDYKSAYGGVSGRLDFNRKLTTLSYGFNYTHSDIQAILDHDSSPYIVKDSYRTGINLRQKGGLGLEQLVGKRQDFALNLGLSQILTRDDLLSLNLGYTRSAGFLENPYKAVTVLFIDPAQLGQLVLIGNRRALLEERPALRNQGVVGLKWVHYLASLDAALHLGYQFARDDWGIAAHTFEAQWIQPLGGGWTIAPRIRYYSQDQASFYQPYLLSLQPFEAIAKDSRGREIWVDGQGREYFVDSGDFFDASGNPVTPPDDVAPKRIRFNRQALPKHFSSDHRLSGFGALSGGITISKVFAKGVTLEAGFEYYAHAGSLKLSGGGEDAYSDFDFLVANAALKMDLEALQLSGLEHHAHHHHGTHGHHFLPAGLMYAHMMPAATPFMVGYRLMHQSQNGNLLHGSRRARDQLVVAKGCSPIACRYVPKKMEMAMHMLELMYAPSDWLNLMIMPQFMAMEMDIDELSGRPPRDPAVFEHGGKHTTGGVSDTLLATLIRLWHTPGHHLHLGLGLSAPTGDVHLKMRRMHQQEMGFHHFDMQLGSGSFDFIPSLTYTGEQGQWWWGGQLLGTVRLEENDAGWRRGHLAQASAWGGYSLTDWLGASVRGVYTFQGKMAGDVDGFSLRLGPMDFPQNAGGKFFDLGFGLSAIVPSGPFAGNTLRFEWLQPVMDDFYGYQLKREGALTFTWSYTF